MENSVDKGVDKLRQQVDDFLNLTQSARELSERDRDYYNNYQWSDDERAKLEKRKQAPITVNRVKPKIEGMKGLLIQRRTDPKAYPRNRNDEKGAEAVTDALRYVADAVDLDDIEIQVADSLFVEGYGACLVDTEEGKDGQQNVDVTVIPWDRFYYDPHSRRADFKDARFMGIVVWMDQSEAKAKFPDKKEEIENALNMYDMDETLDDRPKWITGKSQKRIRVCQHFWINDDGAWQMAYITHNAFLVDAEDSPYLDEFGEPSCPIEAISAYTDRENQRYGEVRYYIDLQDEINHRRSKALFLLSARQTSGRKGSIKDVNKMKMELAKPDGHVEYEGDTEDFKILTTGDMAQGQFLLLQQAQQELDSTSFNAQMAGQRSGEASGRAINLLQQGGMLETLPLFNAILSWKKRVYRQVWHRIKQYWTEEKWIRVTDDMDALRWVGLNIPVLLGQYLQEVSEDKAKPVEMRLGAASLLAQLQQAAPERLQEVIEVQNPIPEMDMDIVLENAPDSINTQAEQFQLITQLAAARPEIPLEEVIRLSQLRGKEELIKAIEERQAQAMAMAQGQQQQQQQKEQADLQIRAQESAAKVDRMAAETGKINMESINQQLENLIIGANPSRVTSIST